MITIKQTGNFKNTEQFLAKAAKVSYLDILNKYGQIGVSALASATPVDSGLTSQSWDYQIKISKGSFIIYWTNSNKVDGVLIAAILQYGHGTKNGGYVQGRDYINPAIQPIFDKILDEAWREVTK
jgi:hypothetical protein